MRFIEPDKLSPESFNAILETVDIQDENREWLRGLFSTKGIAPDFEETLRTIVEKINLKIPRIDTEGFRTLFMFDPEIPDCFDARKLASEKTKIIPRFFMPLWNGKHGIFKPYIADILPQIKQYVEQNEAFFKAYQQKLHEMWEASTLAERACGYLQMQKLSRQNFDEKPPSTEKALATALNDTNYPLNLVSELEEIPRNTLSISCLPFLVYGKEVYMNIYNAYSMMGIFSLPHKGSIENVIQQITIPKWNKENHIHWIFFHLAIVSKDITILDKIFEGIDAAKIPYIFLNILRVINRCIKYFFWISMMIQIRLVIALRRMQSI